MKQYWEIKSLHQDKVLFFRMGDFYEMFFDDAVKAAPLLGIALTQRNKKSADETPMCGFPHHSVAGPINKLLAHGLKVAICDQIEDPKTAKGIVKRAVTRVLTPGMVYDPETLDQSLAHYIASFDFESLAVVDMTTGEAFYFDSLTTKEIQKLLSVLPIAELVGELNTDLSLFPTGLVFSPHETFNRDHRIVGENKKDSITRLVSYLLSLNSEDQLSHVQSFSRRDFKKRMEVNPTTLRHLEVFSTYKGEGLGSLFFAINRTKTSSGSRLLRQWLSFPLRDQSEILERQQRVDNWFQKPAELKRLREVLGGMGDIERRLGKLSQPQCNARDLLSLAHSLNVAVESLNLAGQFVPGSYTGSIENLNQAREISDEILRSFVEDPPLSTKQGYLFRKGLYTELDELIELSTESQAMMAKLEAREKEATGISSLKIRYNNVFGFYIEVTNTHKDKVPSHYQRKQTLANAERYCTDELIELEKKVLSAQTKRNDLEYEIFEQIRHRILKNSTDLLKLAQDISQLDVITAFAWLAIEGNYCRPQFSKNRRLYVKAHRHPVVEQNVQAKFIPNDILVDAGSCLLLTGPNMAGKSTLMRQVALTAILAQVGSFVPAREAELPLYDAIFTRIGASDQLSEGLSTFMVEMSETAAMLKEATENSLLILDEVGRGTSTFDGMSLAQSILEYLVSKVRSTLFFATHYHELTALSLTFPQIHNAHMSVVEKNGDIRFLYTLQKGPAQKSYGIQVAELAGLPKEVTLRAKSILKDFEMAETKSIQQQLSFTDVVTEAPTFQPNDLSERDQKLGELGAEISQAELAKMTPLEALNRIAKWQKDLEGIDASSH